jgi:hypothetical protein
VVALVALLQFLGPGVCGGMGDCINFFVAASLFYGFQSSVAFYSVENVHGIRYFQTTALTPMVDKDAERLAAPHDIHHIDVRSAQMVEPSYRQASCLKNRGGNEVMDAGIRIHAVTHELAKHTHSCSRIPIADRALPAEFVSCLANSADRLAQAINTVANLTAAAAASDRRFAAKVAEFSRLAAAADAAAAEDRRLAAAGAALAAEDRKTAADAADRMTLFYNEMEQDLLEMNAMLENLVIRSRNRYAFKDFSSHGRNEPLAPLYKERAGAGVALPGVRAHLIIPMLAVGDAAGA